MKVHVTWLVAVLMGLMGGPARAVDQAATAQLLAAYVPPTLLTDQPILALQDTQREFIKETDLSEATRARQLTEAQRWDRFESEFGVQNQTSSALESGLRSAKYDLDRTVFALNGFVETVADALEFEYRFGDNTGLARSSQASTAPLRRYFSPLRDALENTRLRSDVDLNVGSGQAWIGMRLVVPFGE